MKVRIIGVLLVTLVLGALAYLTDQSSSAPQPVQPIATPSDNAFKDLKIN